MDSCCFIGRGKAYISEANTGLSWGFNWGYSWSTAPSAVSAGRFIGNVTSLTISPTHSFKTISDTSELSGGSECAASVIESIEVSMTLSCHSISNLKDALYGTSFNQVTPLPPVVSDVIIAPSGVFQADSFVAFRNIGVDTSTVVIIDQLTLVPLVLGTQYTVSPTGITFLQGYSGNVTVSYSYLYGFECVEAFMGVPKPVQILIDGINAADTDELFQVRLYKVRLSPTSNLAVIGDDFSDLTLSGVLMKSKAIKDPTKSKFLSMKKMRV